MTPVDQLELLIEPFRTAVLPHLPAGALAHLRCTCRLLQEVVDFHTGPSWSQAASQLIDPAMIPEAQHGLPVQAKLWAQGRIVAQLLSGDTSAERVHSCSITPSKHSKSPTVQFHGWAPTIGSIPHKLLMRTGVEWQVLDADSGQAVIVAEEGHRLMFVPSWCCKGTHLLLSEDVGNERLAIRVVHASTGHLIAAFEAKSWVFGSAKMNDLEAAVTKVEQEIDEVKAEIQTAVVQGRAEDARQLREKEEQLRKKEEQLREEKLSLLRAPGRFTLKQVMSAPLEQLPGRLSPCKSHSKTKPSAPRTFADILPWEGYVDEAGELEASLNDQDQRYQHSHISIRPGASIPAAADESEGEANTKQFAIKLYNNRLSRAVPTYYREKHSLEALQGCPGVVDLHMAGRLQETLYPCIATVFAGESVKHLSRPQYAAARKALSHLHAARAAHGDI
ncbi:hypothetical protein WJX84_001965 [Apatococcus fuscideae]|uniref:F-box domain-containing protein n=1 Tax=Apatococcus fuscideae TaxID=2026836 RepID=A0AAW1T413_9CHLO